MRPCLCDNINFNLDSSYTTDQCRLCWLYHFDSRYRSLWGNSTQAAVPQNHLVCVNLGKESGKVISCPSCKGSVRIKLFDCQIHGVCTLRKQLDGIACCVGCADYCVADKFVAQEEDPPCGVVIGCWSWPKLVELQIKLIRHTCGPVPILVSDDNSPLTEEIEKICAGYSDVSFARSISRIGHSSGDVAAYWRGIIWAKEHGLRFLGKLSQRMLVLKSRWLQDGARALQASGLAAASQKCVGSRETWPIRTECLVLDVDKWHRQEILDSIKPEQRGIPAEIIIHNLLVHFFGVGELEFMCWGLLGEDRYVTRPGIVWHCANPPADYHRVASFFGISLDESFHTEGWQKDKAAGKYLFG